MDIIDKFLGGAENARRRMSSHTLVATLREYDKGHLTQAQVVQILTIEPEDEVAFWSIVDTFTDREALEDVAMIAKHELRLLGDDPDYTLIYDKGFILERLGIV